MIKLFEGQKASLYKVQKDLGLGKFTLYRYANGTRKIQNMDIILANKLAKYFGMSLDDFYKAALEYVAKKTSK